MSNDVSKKEASSKEVRLIEYMAVLDKKLSESGERMEERIRSVPDLYRQYRIAQVAMDKLIRGLYDTLPPKSLRRMQREAESCEVSIRPVSSLNNFTDSRVVLLEDLDAIISVAMRSTCSICMKEGADIRKCKLRNALIDIAEHYKITDGALCEYAYEATDDVLKDGDYI